MNTVPAGPIAAVEDVSLPIAGISVNDVDGNLATTQLTVGNGTLNVSLAGGATISSGANGSNTLTLSGTQAQINAALATVTYQGTLDFNGADALTVLSTDSAGTPLSDTDVVVINVAAVNDAPVNTVPAGPIAAVEDVSLPIAGISVIDVDGNLATTQLTVGNGTLNVSLAGGATISSGANGSNTLTLSGTQAQINAALATVTYQGTLDFNGADALTVLSTDSAGTPLSDTDVVVINVAAVNDAPVNTVPAGPIAAVEDVSLPIAGISVIDVDGNLATTQLTVGNGTLNVSLAGGATISSGANGSNTLTLSGTQAQINAALATVTYQGTLDFNGADALTVLSTDSAGTPLSDTDVVVINVAAVNDAPVNTVPAGPIAAVEDVSLPIAGISVIDVDGNLATTQLTVGNGTLNVSLAGGATISSGANGSNTLTLSGTQVQINAALATVTYQGTLDFNGADALTVLSTDSAGTPLSDTDVVVINVAAVNDAPVNTVPAGPIAAVEDVSLPIAGISVIDVDGNLATTQLTVGNGTLNVSLAGGATISSGANGSNTLTLSGTQVQINAALATVTYQGTLDFNGADALTVLSTDSAGTPLSDTDVVVINVAAVNDAPVNTVPAGPIAAVEDVSLPIAGISVIDVDGNLATTQLTVGNGTLNVTAAGGAVVTGNGSGSVLITGNAAAINATLALNVNYQGNLNFNGADALTVLSTDSAGTPLSDTDVVVINVAAVADAPVNTVPAGPIAAVEDVSLPIAGISVLDLDVGNATELGSTRLTVGNGTLNVTAAGGAVVTGNGSGSVLITGNAAAINATLALNVNYQGNLNFNGADALTVLSTDSAGTPLSDTDVVVINVAAVADAPVNTVPAGPIAAVEDVSLPIAGISVLDLDVGNATELGSTRLTVGNGTLNVTAAGGAVVTGNGSGSVLITGNAAAINATLALNVNYQGNPNFNGADALTVLSTDSSGVPLSDTDVVVINVAAVADAPVNTVPGAQVVNENTVLPIAGISVLDLDVGNATELGSTRLTVGNGTLNVTAAGGAVVTGNGSGSVLITGNAAAINATLALNVNYQGNLNFNGADALTVLSTDSAGTPLSDTDVVVINVAAVADAPVNTVPAGPIAAVEDVSLPIAGISVLDLDVGNATELGSTRLTVGNGTLNVTAAGGAVVTGNGSGSVLITGNAAAINATLALNVNYQGNPNFNGADALTVLSTDSSGVPLSDTDVVVINVAAVADAPVNTVPGAQVVNENTVLPIAGISVLDLDVGNATELGSTRLTVGNGTLNVTAAGGAVVTGNGSGSVLITGNAAAINATLALNVNYQGALNFNGTDTLTVLSTDIAGVPLPLSVSATVTITVNPIVTFTPPTPPIEDRLFLEPEWFLNTDSILNTDNANEAIYRWQTVNDPRTPISSAIRENYNNVDDRLNVQSNSESVAPTHVQNAVRGMELEPSATSTIQQAVTASQKESISNDIRVNSVRNNMNSSESNIMDVPEDNKGSVEPSLQKATEDGHDKSSIRDSVTTEEKGSKDDAQGEKLKPVKDTLEVNERNIYDFKPVNDQIQDNKINLKTNPENKKAAKSFSDQLQHMAKNARTSSNGVPGNK